MHLRNPIFIGLFCCGMFACSDDDPATTPDPIPDPRAADPINGGGTTGGAIDDVLTLFVQNRNFEPISDAIVRIELADATLESKSDDAGRVDFNDDALAEMLSTHVFHSDYQFWSSYGFDASIITIVLDAVEDPEKPALEIGTVTGTISGWDLLAPNQPDVARVATVSAVGPDVVNLEQPPRPGTVTPGNPTGTQANLLVNGVSPFPAWTNYRLDLDTRTTTLVLFGGTFTVADEPTLEYTHLGFSSTFVAADETRSDQNISISHPLVQEIEVISSEKQGMNSRTRIGVELAEDAGLLTLATLEEGNTSAQAPLLIDALKDARYWAQIEIYSEDEVDEAPAALVTANRGGAETSFTFDRLLDPVGAPTAAGRTLAAAPAASATLHRFTLRNEGKTYWTALVLGDATRSITLPEVPKGLDDPLSGTLILVVEAFDLGELDLNEASFDQIAEEIRSTAISRGRIAF